MKEKWEPGQGKTLPHLKSYWDRNYLMGAVPEWKEAGSYTKTDAKEGKWKEIPCSREKPRD